MLRTVIGKYQQVVIQLLEILQVKHSGRRKRKLVFTKHFQVHKELESVPGSLAINVYLPNRVHLCLKASV